MAEEGASGYRRRPSESERRLARRHNVTRADCMDGGRARARALPESRRCPCDSLEAPGIWRKVIFNMDDGHRARNRTHWSLDLRVVQWYDRLMVLVTQGKG